MSNDLDTLMDLERKKVEWLLANAILNGTCLECHLSKDKDGYAQVRVHGKNLRAHRLVYKYRRGEIGDLYVLHTCDNPACINPEHLFLGTAQDNMTDLISKGRRQDGRGNCRALSSSQLKEVFELRAQGLTQQAIADRFRVNQSTISLYLSNTWGDKNV
ncbi:MAG: HNH endonuclease [Patescibacteria group bacterium]|nr:HNH endonuclease [Patescibacteria group bacterium]